MHIKCDKSLYFKIERFLAYNSIYVWKVLLKSFLTVCRTMPKVQSVKSYKNRSVIPKSYLNANVFGSTNAKELEKSSFWSTNKLQSAHICCLLWFQTLIFGILMYLKWLKRLKF